MNTHHNDNNKTLAQLNAFYARYKNTNTGFVTMNSQGRGWNHFPVGLYDVLLSFPIHLSIQPSPQTL